MSTPTDLSPPADNVGEDVRRGPWIRVMDNGVDLIFSGIVDTQTLLQEMLVDIGLEILGTFGDVRLHMIS